MNWLEWLLRVLHIAGAIVLLGSLATMFFVVGQIPDEQADSWKQTRRRWSLAVMFSSAILLVTGLINTMQIASRFSFTNSNYHMWLGIKILLALVLMMAASILSGRSQQACRCRTNRWCWIVSIILAVVLVSIAAYLKLEPRTPRSPELSRLAAPRAAPVLKIRYQIVRLLSREKPTYHTCIDSTEAAHRRTRHFGLLHGLQSSNGALLPGGHNSACSNNLKGFNRDLNGGKRLAPLFTYEQEADSCFLDWPVKLWRASESLTTAHSRPCTGYETTFLGGSSTPVNPDVTEQSRRVPILQYPPVRTA